MHINTRRTPSRTPVYLYIVICKWQILDFSSFRRGCKQDWDDVIEPLHDRAFFTSRYLKSTLETSMLVDVTNRGWTAYYLSKHRCSQVSRSVTVKHSIKSGCSRINSHTLLLCFSTAQRYSQIRGVWFKILLSWSSRISSWDKIYSDTLRYTQLRGLEKS